MFSFTLLKAIYINSRFSVSRATKCTEILLYNGIAFSQETANRTVLYANHKPYSCPNFSKFRNIPLPIVTLT